MKRFISSFLPSYATALVYMLQSTEYQVKPYLNWYRRVGNFRTVAKRRSLDLTGAAKLLLAAARIGIGVHILIALALLLFGGMNGNWVVVGGAMVLFLIYPKTWAYAIVMPIFFGRLLIVEPKQKRLITQSKRIFETHKGTIIGIAGSYGKTTVKELLGTILGASKKVAITPANKNVAISHAYFAQKLTGDEEVLVIEYGEGRPGDVESFVETTRPDIGIITGIAPAHLDQYPSLEAAEADIFSLADYLKGKPVYVNGESPISEKHRNSSHLTYSREGVGGFRVSDVSVSFEGTRFTLKEGSMQLSLHSGLLGRHMIGPLCAAASIALNVGMSPRDIETAVSQTRPYEHRMQPRQIGGGWIIDDTYNGNLEGFRAGLELLKELPAKRKVYVTPGLVDQGAETERVHLEIGQLIAEANPDKVVLMQNSVTKYINEGLQSAGYEGECVIESDPLAFYVNIDQFIADGDLIMMQNDWTDNYA